MDETSRTYTNTNNFITPAKIDDLEAMRAAIVKRVSTERYDCPLYSFDYGIQTADLLGQDELYVASELKRRIKECLLEDDRILDVYGFSHKTTGDSMLITFTVKTIYGSTSASKEV